MSNKKIYNFIHRGKESLPKDKSCSDCMHISLCSSDIHKAMKYRVSSIKEGFDCWEAKSGGNPRR